MQKFRGWNVPATVRVCGCASQFHLLYFLHTTHTHICYAHKNYYNFVISSSYRKFARIRFLHIFKWKFHLKSVEMADKAIMCEMEEATISTETVYNTSNYCPRYSVCRSSSFSSFACRTTKISSNFFRFFKYSKCQLWLKFQWLKPFFFCSFDAFFYLIAESIPPKRSISICIATHGINGRL